MEPVYQGVLHLPVPIVKEHSALHTASPLIMPARILLNGGMQTRENRRFYRENRFMADQKSLIAGGVLMLFLIILFVWIFRIV